MTVNESIFNLARKIFKELADCSPNEQTQFQIALNYLTLARINETEALGSGSDYYRLARLVYSRVKQGAEVDNDTE